MNFESAVIAVGIVVVSAVGYVVWQAHKDAPRLRAECEAKGGILIQARDPAYVCVGKPIKLEGQ